MENGDFLETKIVTNYKDSLQKKLEKNVLLKMFSSEKFISPAAGELGLALLENQGYRIELGSKEEKTLSKLLTKDIWNSTQYYNLLELFFGIDVAPYVKYAWDDAPHRMYQLGYSRRSFRAPNNQRLTVLNQLNFIVHAIKLPKKSQYCREDQHYKLNLEEQIRYDHMVYNNSSAYLIWAAAIDMGNNDIFQLMQDIVYGQDSIGKPSRNIIKALLHSKQEKCWKLVEQLLLSAQRQEGLRQTVLESLDETSLGAFKYMINVVVEHKLARFSSVVRAVDTWTGLNWGAEKETTVRSILELSQKYFNNPDEIKKAISSTNNQEVYMALWVQGVFDVEKTVIYLHELLEKGSIEKKCLALKFAYEVNIVEIQMPLYYKSLEVDNLQVLAFTLLGMKSILYANIDTKTFINNPEYPEFLEKIYTLAYAIPEKKKTFDGKVFSWLKIEFDKSDLLLCMTYLLGDNKVFLDKLLLDFEKFPLEVREQITYKTLGLGFSIRSIDKSKIGEVTEFKRKFAIRLLKDRGEFMRACALAVLETVKFKEDELCMLQELLKSTSKSLKSEIIDLILKQKDSIVIGFVNDLFQSNNKEKNKAILNIMTCLYKSKRLLKNVKGWYERYSKKEKLSDDEIKSLSIFTPDKKTETLCEENGYGFYKPGVISAYKLPKINSQSSYIQSVKDGKYGYSISQKQLQKKIKELYDLYLLHKDYEYEITLRDNSKQSVLLGNDFSPLLYDIDHNRDSSDIEKFKNYPLYEKWEHWFLNSGLTLQDLFLLNVGIYLELDFAGNNKYILNYEDYMPKEITELYPYYGDNPLYIIFKLLSYRFLFTHKNDLYIDATILIFGELPSKIIKFKNDSTYSDEPNGWQTLTDFNYFLDRIRLDTLNDEQTIKVWNIYRWRQFNGLKRNIKYCYPPLYLFCKAYELDLISKDELYEQLLTQEGIRLITQKPDRRYIGNLDFNVFTFLNEISVEIQETFLNIELERGEDTTSVSILVQEFENIYGIENFVRLLVGLKKSKLTREHIYVYHNIGLDRTSMFNYLLRKCSPVESDNQEKFNSLISQHNISDKRLLELTMYTPVWQKYITNYLKWDMLESGIWWFHAHTKIDGYGANNSQFESEVAKYSSLEFGDFQNGAVDKDWFLSAYEKLGKEKWKMLFDASKYAGYGNGHARAKLYSSVLTGDLKIREITTRIKEKRHQDSVRVYGLIPLSKNNREKDILDRYDFLQQFKQESKQFGSMKQASESEAINIGLENLARNAGYTDPIRLTWWAESQRIKKIFSDETSYTDGEVKIELIINEIGKAEVITHKNGKTLKSIPAGVKKQKNVKDLLEKKKILNKQWEQSKKAFEDSMIRCDKFTLGELNNLSEHPIIGKHIEKLLFITDSNIIGFYGKNTLQDVNNNTVDISNCSYIRVAHCSDLFNQKVWESYQHICFEKNLIQPFKQIFRELYTPTPDEIKEISISRRYAGHQVQPKQALALFKSRGWKVDYEEGLQKVFHEQGLQVKIYAMADWFTPGDIESPTLETIEFHSLHDYRNMAFEEINPILFSEVMRDIDLVVSVAHVGKVDPEVTQSSIEMRRAILSETIKLFNFDNVDVEGNFVKIHGELGEYNIHIGSAIVHKVPGRQISILPIHSSHRGKIFLPFLDSDPKTSELLSKVILFAKDNKIQDPTILEQIMK